MLVNSAPTQSGQDVFDVANWLERATGQTTIAPVEYTPRHRAEVPVDSRASFA